MRELWPDIREMLRPRRRLLAIGFVLMVIGSDLRPGAAGIDEIPDRQRHRQEAAQLLAPLVLAVVAATIIQGITSFANTQLMSKAAQRLIAELRQKVQAHIGRLPVSYYDANKAGTLVSRIMTDVEGMRNLLGTGLIEFVGGLLTAVLVLGILLRISALLTRIALVIIVCVRAGSAESIQNHPAHLPRARQDQRRGDRPADRIAGRRARHQGLSRRSARRRGIRRRRAAAAQ